MPAPDKTVLWIASYPKSGNTWLRFLVCNLVFGPQDSAATLNVLAPDIHEQAAAPAPPAAPMFMKTHFPCSPALPLASHTAAALYIVRHPADVMLSNFHYAKRSSAPESVQDALAQYFENYLAARGDPRWIKLHMGAWDDHVRSWLAVRHPFPILSLRYEDLLADATQAARQICTFLGLTRNEVEIACAVGGASFQRMREIEEADIRRQQVGIFYKPYLQSSIDAGLRFMRAGRAGSFSRTLTAQQRSRLAAVFGGLMQELGYDTV